MSNFTKEVINKINAKGFCKLENFLEERDLNDIDLKLKNIKEYKIIKGDRIGHYPCDTISIISSLIKLKFQKIFDSIHLNNFSNRYSLNKIADEYFKSKSKLKLIDSYFSPKSNEKIIDWHADIPIDLPSNPDRYKKWQRHLKFFIYLTDVDHNNGCLAYLPESNKINKAITNLVLNKKIKINRFTELTRMREILLTNKELRYFLELDNEIGKEKLDIFIDNTKFVEEDGDTTAFDINLKKGGMIIFDEFGFHRGSSPSLTDRVVLRFLYKPSYYFYQS